MTNRPSYAPDRRPGENMNELEFGDELVILVTTINDAATIAAAIDAGAAAWARYPMGTAAVARLDRNRSVELCRAAAAALIEERSRVYDRAHPQAKPKTRKATP